ncbi:MAG: septum formation protein Maf [Cytophagaceae bacterium]|nr:septum formation protein Maf [Cytophagaceae bacterium]
MAGQKIILGSQSPRRKTLLEGLGISPEVRINDMDESIPANLPAHQAPEYLAKKKAIAFLPLLKEGELLITADTVVIVDDQVINKPVDLADAKVMLRRLSGRKHQVVSGVCISSLSLTHSFSETTSVFFRPLSEEQIAYYVEHYKPLDKAGAYGIQEWIGLVAIEKIEGDFYNVMGLPVGRLVEEMRKLKTEN